MEFELLNVHIRGVSATMMQSDILANPLHPMAKRMSALTAKKNKKTDSDRLEMAEIEFRASLYWDRDLGPYWPDLNIERCLRDGAKMTRQGKDVERGLSVASTRNALIYNGPRTADELLVDPDFVDSRSVRVGTSRVMRCRPIFNHWELKFDLRFDPAIFKNAEEVKAIVVTAGKYVGLSVFRPRYGRFEVVSLKNGQPNGR